MLGAASTPKEVKGEGDTEMRLRYRSAGESHGPSISSLIEGLPKGLPLDLSFVDGQLRRRQGGYGRGARQKIEGDHAELLSGLRGGLTIGSPLLLRIENRDATIEKLPQPTRPRPGHVDLATCLKHADFDIRGGLERSSARETAARVAAGAVAQLLLRRFGVEVLGFVTRIGAAELDPDPLGAELCDAEALRKARDLVEKSPFGARVPGADASAEIDACRRDGDTVGGEILVVAAPMLPGLGSNAQWDERLDARIAGALISIPAMKAVGFGAGSDLAARRGSGAHDPILPAGPGGLPLRASNHAGGIEGGISNGQPVVCRLSMKPIATLGKRLPSIDLASGEVAEAGYERSDLCAVPAASVVAEAMLALVLADALVERFGGANLEDLEEAASRHAERLRGRFGPKKSKP